MIINNAKKYRKNNQINHTNAVARFLLLIIFSEIKLKL